MKTTEPFWTVQIKYLVERNFFIGHEVWRYETVHTGDVAKRIDFLRTKGARVFYLLIDRWYKKPYYDGEFHDDQLDENHKDAPWVAYNRHDRPIYVRMKR